MYACTHTVLDSSGESVSPGDSSFSLLVHKAVTETQYQL